MSVSPASAGSLNVHIETPSYFLGSSMPIEVRDASLHVVGEGQGSWQGDLPAGLYSIRGMTPDGMPLHELVRVDPGEVSDVVLSEQDLKVHGRRFRPQTVLPADPDPPGNSSSGVQFIEANNCVAEERSDGWVFLPLQHVTAVPTARFRVDSEEWLLSLPLNPRGDGPDRSSCVVSAVRSGSRTRLQLSYAPKRRVTAFVDGLRRSRGESEAGDILDQASMLLWDKYHDPAGATLGGLALQRRGGLDSHRGWVENLARSFGWIPDASILLASALVGDPARRPQAFELLVTAARQRPMFTDGLSLALDLIRHWPDPGGPGRDGALEHLATLSAWADWDSVNLTTVTGAGR